MFRASMLKHPTIQNLGMPTNQPVTQLFQEHKIVCVLPDLACSHIFFHFKSFSRWSGILIPLSPFPQPFGKRPKKTSLAIERNLTDSSPALSFEIEPASFAILQQTILLGLSVWLTGQLMFRASIQLFVILDAAVHWQNQHITNFLLKVPVILMPLWWYQAPFLGSDCFICSHKMVPNTCEKCSWKGMKTFCVTLNNR